MAYPDVSATRLHGLDMSVFTIGGVAFLGHIQNGNVEIEMETQESRATMDQFAYPKPRHKSWRVTGTLVVDTTG